ncbi:hypothetical protein CRUP_009380, partial [Coryphaenoides rupestris]
MAESDPRPAMCHPSPLLLLLCCWCLAGRTQQSHGSSLQDNMRELHDRFAVSLYQTLTETENNNSNLIVSPVSVSLSLGLLQLGARGSTLAQLEGALGYNMNGRLLPLTPGDLLLT